MKELPYLEEIYDF
jgi:hypothetical protein